MAVGRYGLHAIIALLCLGLLAGCAGGEAPDEGVPDWVLAVPDDDRYAYGVGSAPLENDAAEARRIATNRARGELLASMAVRVSGESRTWVERVRTGDAGPVTRGFAEQVRARVPETTLEEIEVAEVAPDAAGETLYVLVRLDRPAARLRLSTEWSRLRERVNAAAARNPDPADPLAVIRALGPAAALIEQAGELESRLRLVSGGRLPARSMAEAHAELLDKLARALDGLVFHIEAADMPERVRTGLEAGLLDAGVRVGGDGPPDLVIGGNARLRTVSRGPDQFVHADAAIRITEPDGRLVAQFNERVREASTDEGLATDRALRTLAEAVGHSLGERLFNMLQV